MFSEFKALKYRFMASFGAKAEGIFIDTNALLSSIFVSAELLGTRYWQRQGRVPMEPEEFQQHLNEMEHHERIFWDDLSGDDDVQKQLDAIRERLDALVRPCLQEPMRAIHG